MSAERLVQETGDMLWNCRELDVSSPRVFLYMGTLLLSLHMYVEPDVFDCCCGAIAVKVVI